MAEINELSLETIISYLENGARLSLKEISKFKKSEYCREAIDIEKRNQVIILNKSIGGLFEITLYYHPKNKAHPYSTLP